MTEPLLVKTRVHAIDFLKGFVMVVMALDHVRDYFNYSAFFFDPADPVQSNLPLFFTRWITHFCAPTFSFLAGMSAFIVGKRKSKNELSVFLVKRGLWLVFIEVTVVGFAWFFDPQFHTFLFATIWSLGWSMVVLSLLVQLPFKFILVFSLVLIFGHNLLDNIHFSGNILWTFLHERHIFEYPGNRHLMAAYPLIPWMGVMSLGYCCGKFYTPSFTPEQRKKAFNIIGLTAIVLFIILRYTNVYGDAKPYVHYDSWQSSIISFFNPTKYPPSLDYLLMTLGAAFLFLGNFENIKGWVVNFFTTFGRVPFFYYMLHLYLIHLGAMLAAQLTGYGWHTMILPNWIRFVPQLQGYGFSLPMVYIIWALLIIVLYPLCKRFDKYKQAHKENWWLSYL